jgi:ABC-type transport system substrate-binding protein
VVERLSAESSVCLVVEDLHWADESTLELLQALLPVTEEAAVGLVLLYRSERDHGSWRLGEHARQRYPHRYREIELRPLPDDASRTLATAAAGAELPESVADLLAMRAGDNPYFLEEALHDLIERGALQRSDGHYVLAVDASELSVPALVQGALQARLDRLGRETRDVVSIAAVIGRTFELPLLEEVLPEEHLLPSLTELQRLDLVVERRRRPVAEYSFRHGLVQEVAYASLVEAKRRKLHRLVGEALERLNPASAGEICGVLARHFAEADEAEKAAHYLLRAGDAARALYADQEAVEHYSRARGFLARLADNARMRETLFKIALARHLVFDFEGAEDAYDEAFCCRVEEPAPPVATERLVTTTERLRDIVPGDVYSMESLQITELLFRGLVAVDDAMTVVPDVADNLRVSSDGLTYLFRLREGVMWSDGEPLTAGDFVYAWDRLREEDRRTAFLLADIDSADALDDRTLEVRVREPRSYFPFLLASWAFPWPRHRCEDVGDAWRLPENLVSNGPFTLAELSDRRALLVANRYWNGPRGNVGEIEVEFAASDSEVVAGWDEGRFDVATVHDDRARHAPDTVPVEASLLSLNFLGFRADAEPFSNELLRRAFAHALDRSRLAPSFGALTRLATRRGALPPAMPGHSPRAGIDYDPDAARALLAEAGHPEGRGLPPLELLVPDWLEQPETLVDQWVELGIEIGVRRGGLSLCEADLGDAHLFVAGWTADFPDPDGLFLGLYGGRDWPLYTDDEIDELLRQARAVRNQSERMRLFHEIDRTWVRDRAALVPLTYKRMLLLQRPWVESVTVNALGRTNLACAVLSRPGRNGS